MSHIFWGRVCWAAHRVDSLVGSLCVVIAVVGVTKNTHSTRAVALIGTRRHARRITGAIIYLNINAVRSVAYLSFKSARIRCCCCARINAHKHIVYELLQRTRERMRTAHAHRQNAEIMIICACSSSSVCVQRLRSLQRTNAAAAAVDSK